MKKALIPAALLLSLTGAAHAEFTLYGLLDASVGQAISDDQVLTVDPVTGLLVNKAKTKVNLHSGGDEGNGEGNSTSRFGIKGSTDVGSGIKANFKLESNGITSTGDVNSPFFGRAAWVGLSGGFGEFRFGKQDSVPFQTFIDFDFNGASNGISSAQYSNAGRWLLLGRQARSLQYITPALGGFKGQLGLQVKDQSADPAAKDVVSGAGTFAAGPVSVAASFQTKGTTDTTMSNYEDYAGVAGTFDFGVGKVTLGYHDQKTEGKGATVGVNFTVADINLGGIYYKETNRTKGASFELYVNKEVLKGTYAYAEVGVADKNAEGPGGGFGKGTGFAVGLIYTF